MYFYGDLVQGRDLARTARLRKRKCQELTVSRAERDSYLAQGWAVGKEFKTRLRLHLNKQHDELLEDKVWLLFNNMGFIEMNKDRNFKIQAGQITKQLDVFARDGNNAFIVECKASVDGAQTSRKDILEISDLRKDITDSVRKNYSDRNIRVSFIMATKGMQWSETNEKLAENRGIFVWKEAELEYYGELVKHLGNSARYQVYSTLFRDKKAYELTNITVPAIYGGRGGAKYYSFIIQPEKLLQVAYIHHRRGTREELLSSYQRMLEKTRLGKIDRFISKGGYFPNNIIINFTKKPRFDKKAEVGDIVYGILTFPPYYASAWVIDGQHRLYGYANSRKKSTDTIPVLAFDSLDVRDQANLFVEINREQKAVPPNLLWDLYPDIYRDPNEEEQQILRTISLVAKKLNSDNDSPLRDNIKIPSVPSKGREITNLTITTVCDAIKENGLINREQMLLYKDGYDSTVDFASERLKVCFNVIAESFPEDWEKGNQGLLRSNIGIRILFTILRQLMRYLKHTGQEGIYRKKDLAEFKGETEKLLSPGLTKLKDMSDKDRNRIRGQTSKGGVLENARQIAWWVKEEFEGFGLELLGDWKPQESDEEIRQLVEDTEIQLRIFIGNELVRLRDKRWWKEGIPDEVRRHIEEVMHKKIADSPYREDELSEKTPLVRLSYTTIGDLKQIIKHTPNWPQFERTFKNQEKAVTNLDYLYRLRNMLTGHPPSRPEQIDEIAKQQGIWAMKWIRRCIKLEE